MLTMGLSAELKKDGVAVNSLWPRTTIATAAVKNVLGGEELMRQSRRPEIVADAAYFILGKNSRETTGNFFIDDNVLAAEGITDLSGYAVDPSAGLMQDIFL